MVRAGESLDRREERCAWDRSAACGRQDQEIPGCGSGPVQLTAQMSQVLCNICGIDRPGHV